MIGLLANLRNVNEKLLKYCTFLFFQLKVPTSDKPEVTVNFRKLLLNRCQKEFEKGQG